MILGVAIMWDGVMYAMPRPARHHNIIWTHAKYEWIHPGNPKAEAESEQGFYDELGNFLSRREAELHALLFGQVIDCETGEMLDYIPRSTLFSEELWRGETGLFTWMPTED